MGNDWINNANCLFKEPLFVIGYSPPFWSTVTSLTVTDDGHCSCNQACVLAPRPGWRLDGERRRRSLTVTDGRWRSPTVAKGRRRLPTVADGRRGGRRRSPKVADGRRRSPTVADGCRRLPTVADGRRWSPTVAEGRRRSPTVADGRRRLLTVTDPCRVAAIWATRETEETKDNKELHIKTTLRELLVYIVFLILLCVGTYRNHARRRYAITAAAAAAVAAAAHARKLLKEISQLYYNFKAVFSGRQQLN